MIYTRILQKNITLTNVDDIYNTNINDLLLENLRNTFKNKCYKSSYILDINKILNRSDLNFNNKDLNASVNVVVQFEADVLEYDKYDIINNIKITAITEHKIICQSKYASIFIQNENILKDYTENQIIPIKVGICKYYIGENKISINAFPFIPLKEEIENYVYYKIPQLSDFQINELNNLFILDKIKEVELQKDNIKKEKNNRWDYFNDLLFPYKNYKKNSKNIKNIDILDFTYFKETENIITIFPNQDLSERKLSVILLTNTKTNNKKFGDESNAVSDNPITIFTGILTKYYKYINAINELSTTYKSDEVFKKNENIFNTYRIHKI